MGVEEFDVAVVGGEVFGLSAALSLAKSGKRTVLLEQHASLEESRGSSAGFSRIIRLASEKFPWETPFVIDSIKAWMQLQEQDGFYQALKKKPVLIIGEKSDQRVHQMAQSLYGGNVEWQDPLNINSVHRTNYPEDSIMFYDRNGSIIDAASCIAILQRAFLKMKGVTLTEWKVTNIVVQEDSSILITGSEGSVVHVSHLILAPGPHTNELLEFTGFRLPLVMKKFGTFYWKLKDLKQTPITFVESCSEGDFLGIGKTPGLLMVSLKTGIEVSMDNLDQADMTPIRKKVIEYVNSRFGNLVHPEMVAEDDILYSEAPDSNIILDRHPTHRNIVFVCGYTGYHFKIAPTIGRIIADMVAGLPTTKFDVKPFMMNRF